nr:hypothetical protein [Tanacetum cinerariifolium]
MSWVVRMHSRLDWLCSDVLAWWKAYKQAKGGDVWLITVTWAKFKELFFLQFFPRAEQERLKREYHSIRQTDTETSTEFMQREAVVTTTASTTTTLATTTGVLVMDVTRETGSRGPSEGYSYPVCTTCGRRHPGECLRAAGTYFKCGQTGHLQKDCKKNTAASTSGQAD